MKTSGGEYMKKNLFVFALSAVIIGGIDVYFFENIVFANEMEETSEKEKNPIDLKKNKDSLPEEGEENDDSLQWENQSEEKQLESGEKEIGAESEEARGDETQPEIIGMNHLLIPQKLQVVIDPWEMDGKSQIYSEEYAIKNTGETSGTLILSDLACQIAEGSGVEIKDDPKGIHDDGNKSAYIEIVFGDRDKVILSQEGAVYKAELKPEEELTLRFSGEVNENAEESWRNGDVALKVTYAWEPEELAVDTGEEEEPVSRESQETDTVTEEKEKPEVLELELTEPEDFTLDFWEADENGDIHSPLYKVKNSGGTAGIFALSELVCRSGEESGIVVMTEKEKPQEAEGRFLYMELVPEPKEQGNAEETEETYLLLPEIAEENPEASDYKKELNPGEEFTFRLRGKLYGVKPEEIKKGDIVVTAVCSLKPEEEIPGQDSAQDGLQGVEPE